MTILPPRTARALETAVVASCALVGVFGGALQLGSAAGIALLAAGTGLIGSLVSPWIPRLAGFGVGVIALAALAVDHSSIDTVAFQGWPTSMALLLLALALLPAPRLADARAITGLGAGVIALVPAIGYVSGVRLDFGLASALRMPPPTVAALIALAIGTLVDARSDAVRADARAGVSRPWRDAILAGVAVAGVGASLALAVWFHADARAHAASESVAERVRIVVLGEIEARIHGLWFHGFEWQARDRPSESEMERNAALLTDVFPSFEALEWIDARGELRWSFPESARPRMPAPGLQLRARAAKSDAASPRDGADAWIEEVRLAEATPGIRIFVPVSRLGGKPDGVLAAVFDARATLAARLDNLAVGYVLEIDGADSRLYARGGPLPSDAVSADLALPGGGAWTIRVAPTAAVQTTSDFVLPWLLLGASAGMALLVTLVLFLAQQARARSLALAAANAVLEERVRARTADLERATDDARQFASFVAHELRQPLGTMTIWLELLGGFAGDMDVKAVDYLQQLRRATQRMADLITKQLQLSAVSSSPLALTSIDLGVAARAAAADLETERREAGARFEIGMLPVVRADRQLMQQLFRNLLGNALKYRRPDVPLVVRVGAEDVAEGKRIVGFRVEDNGRGFAPEDADRVFQLFNRLEPDAAEGSGLGLAMCRRIVERHDGAIRAEARLGEGACFHVRLPSTGP